MARYQATFKASNMETKNGGGQSNSVFFYADDDASAQAFVTAIQPFMNASFTGLNKQIVADPTNGGPYQDARANGGSDVAQLLFADPAAGSNRTENIRIPFVRHDSNRQALEAAIEGVAGLQMRDGGEIGQLRRLTLKQIIDAA